MKDNSKLIKEGVNHFICILRLPIKTDISETSCDNLTLDAHGGVVEKNRRPLLSDKASSG